MNEQLNIAFDSTNGLSREEYNIWDYLQMRSQGKENAITGDEISKATGITYYRIRQAISHLVNQHERLIASCGKGYFIPVTPDEIAEATRSLRHRGISILARASKLQKTSLEKIFHQARIEFKGGLNASMHE